MQAGALFQVNEGTNVFFMTLRDYFQRKLVKMPEISLPSVYTSLRTGGGKRTSANFCKFHV
jgi:hypothetical protein